MKVNPTKRKSLLIGLLIILIVVIVVWQFSKKSILKEVITESVSKSTEGFYKVDYDSSQIDELGGNARFFNLSFRADSLALTNGNPDSLPKIIINASIKEIRISDADIPSFLTKNSMSASLLEIDSPVITIYQNNNSEVLTKSDSLELYEALLGKFSSIKAKKIKIINGQINVAKLRSAAHTKFTDVNIELNDLLITEEKKYDDIISYFIKGAEMTVKKFESKPLISGKQISAEGIRLNARQKLFTIESINFLDTKRPSEKSFLKGIEFKGLNTNAFVYENKLSADSLLIASGALFIRQSKNERDASQSFEIDNDFFSKAQLKNVFVNSTDVTMLPAKIDGRPTLLRKVNFVATNLPTLNGDNSLQQILNAGKWRLHTDGVDFRTKDGLYDIKVVNVDLDDANKNLTISKLTMLPLISWEAYVKSLKVQHDLYEVVINNFSISGLAINTFINEGKIFADGMTLSPTIKASNDRTVPFDKSSKVGNYPHQILLGLNMPIDIKKVTVMNGMVTYRERGRLSKKIGDVIFSSINASITGFTNTVAGIAREKNMQLDARAEFLTGTNVTTSWTMPLQKLDGKNKVTGTFTNINKDALNKVIEPLGMASVRKGSIDGLKFTWYGDDYKSTGDATLLYNNLKVDVLESDDKTSNDLAKKDLLSFAANVLIKNSNPGNGKTRSASMSISRDISKSFFNFIFKSILEASKKTLIKSL